MAELMSIAPGHCLGCGERITSRQSAHRFPGPNLWRPDLGEGSAVFHARRACAGKAFEYDRQWAAAIPGRRRRFVCEGELTVHADGSPECTAGEHCLGGEMRHDTFTRHSRAWSQPEDCWCVTTAASERRAS